MESTIKIGNKELQIRSSLKTLIDYKSTFGTDLFKDIDKLSGGLNGMGDFSELISILFQVIYVLNKPYSDKTYNEFLDDFDFSIISSEEDMKSITNVFSSLFQSKSKQEGKQTNP